jgi:hypothetical protein
VATSARDSGARFAAVLRRELAVLLGDVVPWRMPWRTFTIDTCLCPQDAGGHLRKVIGQPGFFFPASGDFPFVGAAESETVFVFRRRCSYRRALPTVRAAIDPSWHGGARIRVDVRMYAAAMAFFESRGLIRLALPFFALGGALSGFESEAHKVEQTLRAVYALAPALPAPREAYR